MLQVAEKFASCNSDLGTGPSEKFYGGEGGGAKYKKKFMQGKIESKKIHAQRVSQEKKVPAYGKNIPAKEIRNIIPSYCFFCE